jgi:hypothetical protein
MRKGDYMKKYKLGNAEVSIEIGQKYKESINEYCYYYTVGLKNKYNSKIYYMDFDYFEDDTKNEDGLFEVFLKRGNPFENAMDMDGNFIGTDYFESFLGKDWFDQYYTIYKLGR